MKRPSENCIHFSDFLDKLYPSDEAFAINALITKPEKQPLFIEELLEDFADPTLGSYISMTEHLRGISEDAEDELKRVCANLHDENNFLVLVDYALACARLDGVYLGLVGDLESIEMKTMRIVTNFLEKVITHNGITNTDVEFSIDSGIYLR